MFSSPHDEWIGSQGFKAFLQLCADEPMKASSYLPEAFVDPVLSHSMEPTQAPWNLAFKTNKRLFEWYDDKENERRKMRFSAAMAETAKMESTDAILQGSCTLDPRGRLNFTLLM